MTEGEKLADLLEDIKQEYECSTSYLSAQASPVSVLSRGLRMCTNENELF